MSSASDRSESAVKSTRSRNKTETSRRSVLWAPPAGEVSTLAEGCAAFIADPHSPQNLAAGGFDLPQDEQDRSKGEPHSIQNLRPASLAVPQAAQSKAILSTVRPSLEHSEA